MKRFLALVSPFLLATPLAMQVSVEIAGPPTAFATNSQSTTFVYTGQTRTFTVPAGVFSLDVAMSGAEGGKANVYQGGASGKGGYLSVSVSVNPGDVFKVQVGQQGVSFGVGAQTGSVPAGGWPTGGNGAIAGSWYGAGGGGSTQLIRVANGVDTVVAVAGAGGGAGAFMWGGAGGVTGENTYSDTTPFTITRDATGGNGTTGGVGACTDDGTCSGNGGQLQGGNADTDSYGGGGGGGGYYGGGAGIGNGGGAGGSTWWNTTYVTATNNQTGVREGDGLMEITYTALNPCMAGTYSATGYEPCVQASVNHYVPNAGSTSQTACPSGFVASNVGSIACVAIPASSTSSTTIASQETTTTIANSTAESSLCVGKIGQSLSRSCIIKNLKVTVPSTSRVSPKVSRSSSKICRATGTSVRALKKGTCSLTLTVTPKKGKAKKYTVKIAVL